MEHTPRLTRAQRQEALLIFRGYWGRLFVLAAQALTAEQPYHLDAVKLAVAGQGRARDMTLRRMRQIRVLCNVARDNAEAAGNTREDMVAVWRDAKVAVEQEWDCPLRLVVSS